MIAKSNIECTFKRERERERECAYLGERDGDVSLVYLEVFINVCAERERDRERDVPKMSMSVCRERGNLK